MTRLKGAFALKYVLLVLTLTGRVYAWVSRPNKILRRIMVECIVVFQTGIPVPVLSLPVRELNELLTSTESIYPLLLQCSVLIWARVL